MCLFGLSEVDHKISGRWVFVYVSRTGFAMDLRQG
jgi:hypothetical protein